MENIFKKSQENLVIDADSSDHTKYAKVDSSRWEYFCTYVWDRRARQAFFEDEIIMRQKHSQNDAMGRGFDSVKKEIYEKNLKNMPKMSLFNKKKFFGLIDVPMPFYDWKLKKSEDRINAWRELSSDEIYQFFIKQSSDAEFGGGNIAYKSTVNTGKIKATGTLSSKLKKIFRLNGPLSLELESTANTPKVPVLPGYGELFLFTSLLNSSAPRKDQIIPIYLKLTGVHSYTSVAAGLDISTGIRYSGDEQVTEKVSNKDLKMNEFLKANSAGMIGMNLISAKGKVTWLTSNYRLVKENDRFVVPYLQTERNTALKNFASPDLEKTFFDKDMFRAYAKAKTKLNDKSKLANGGYMSHNHLNAAYELNGKLAKEQKNEPRIKISTITKGGYINLLELTGANGGFRSKGIDKTEKYQELQEYGIKNVRKFVSSLNQKWGDDEDKNAKDFLEPIVGGFDPFKIELQIRASLFSAKSYSKKRSLAIAIPFQKALLNAKNYDELIKDEHSREQADKVVRNLDNSTNNALVKDNYRDPIYGDFINRTREGASNVLNTHYKKINAINHVSSNDLSKGVQAKGWINSKLKTGLGTRDLTREEFLSRLDSDNPIAAESEVPLSSSVLSRTSVQANDPHGLTLAESSRVRSNSEQMSGNHVSEEVSNSHVRSDRGSVGENKYLTVDDVFELPESPDNIQADSIVLQNTFINYTQDIEAGSLFSSDGSWKFFKYENAKIILGLSKSKDPEKDFSKDKKFERDIKLPTKDKSTHEKNLNEFLLSKPGINIRSSNNISYISLCRLFEPGVGEGNESQLSEQHSAIYFGSSFNTDKLKNFIDYLSYYKGHIFDKNIIKSILDAIKSYGDNGGDIGKKDAFIKNTYGFIMKHTQDYLREASESNTNFIRMFGEEIAPEILKEGLAKLVALRKVQWHSGSIFKSKSSSFKEWFSERLEKKLDAKLAKEFATFIGIIADYHNSEDQEDVVETTCKILRLQPVLLGGFLRLRVNMLKAWSQNIKLNGVIICQSHLQMVESIISFLNSLSPSIFVEEHIADSNDKALMERMIDCMVNTDGLVESIFDLQELCKNSAIPLSAMLEHLDHKINRDGIYGLIVNLEKLGMTDSLVIEACWGIDEDLFDDMVDIRNPGKENKCLDNDIKNSYARLRKKSLRSSYVDNFRGFRLLKQENSTNSNVCHFSLGVRYNFIHNKLSVGDKFSNSSVDKKYDTMDPAKLLNLQHDSEEDFREKIGAIINASIDAEIGFTNDEERSSQALITILSFDQPDQDLSRIVRPTIIT